MSYRFNEEVTDTLPMTVGLFLLLLYVLAFFGCMDFSFAIVIAIALWLIAKMSRDDGIRVFACGFGRYFFNPCTVALLLLLAITVIVSLGRMITWWDDINFWASDAKAIYLTGGFPHRYGNVSPEFGDYPPMLQLAKWCMLKLSREYNEGLMFAGYLAFNVIFLFPLLSSLKTRSKSIRLIAVCLLPMLPGIINKMWAEGTCADVSVGILCGATLIAIIDIDKHDSLFYYLRILVFCSVMLLIKDTAVVAGALALLFMILVHNSKAGTYEILTRKRLILTALVTLAIQSSWWIYCIVSRRVSKAAVATAKAATNTSYPYMENIRSRGAVFVQGFVKAPLHTEGGGIINLSSLLFVVIVFVSLLLLYYCKITDKRESKILGIVFAVAAVATYGFIFYMHITSFAAETQYDTYEVMGISISRYAAPVTMSFVCLFLFLILSRRESVGWLLGVACFILLTTDFAAMYRAAFGYRRTLDKDREVHASYLDEDGRAYIDCVHADESLFGRRVIFIRDGRINRWANNAYISYEASPVSTVYGYYVPGETGMDELQNQIEASHAAFVYIEQIEDMDMNAFSEYTDIPIVAQTVYGIENSEGTFTWSKH